MSEGHNKYTGDRGISGVRLGQARGPCGSTKIWLTGTARVFLFLVVVERRFKQGGSCTYPGLSIH